MGLIGGDCNNDHMYYLYTVIEAVIVVVVTVAIVALFNAVISGYF